MKTYKTFIGERAHEANDIVRWLMIRPVVHKAELMNFLIKKYDVRRIGEGSFAAAFAGGKDSEYASDALDKAEYIVKITGGYDAPYEAYAKLAKKYHKNNSLFPNIKYSRKLIGGKHVHILEKINLDAGLETGQDTLEDMVEDIVNKPDEFSNIELYTTIMANANINENEFKRWSKIVYPLVKNSSYKLDLHRGNVGWRDNGEFVIFDPLFDPDSF